MGRQAEALVPARRAPIRKQQSAFAFLGEDATDREPVSLATVDAETMRDAIAQWTSLGHAITIGCTSDGGAIAISLLAGGQRQSKYFNDLALLEDFLCTLRDRAAGE